MEMPSGKGDLGTKSSENVLKKSSAGEDYGAGSHVPKLGSAVSCLEGQMKTRGSMKKDCDY